ncbi:unnamed protein product [Caenorhabditis sp. 36 PRJEB53466]|nr:unnamed protein product [Caenorhabditis sp. 36 PRJEB53466]
MSSTSASSEEGSLDWEKMIWAVVSVTVVSLLSLGGAVIGPLFASDTKHRWLHFFLAMAVSTLSSDAILHIIPEVIGVHNHSHSEHGKSNGTAQDHGHSHEHEHGHGNEHKDEETTWTTITPARKSLLHLSVIVLTIYVLYFIEFFMFYRKTHLHYCTSPTISSPISHHYPPMETTASSSSSSSSSASSCSVTQIEEKEGEENNNDGETERRRKKKREKAGHELINLRESEQDGAEICGLKPRALIILFGDGLHNLVDGIAIGVSFVLSLKLGFMTTIAVVCHELPHEIGDLAVLVDSGLSMCTALLLNLLSALTAYIGLFVSFVLGDNPEVVKVLLALTAGMFLYVAWVDMLSHLKHDSLMADHWIITSILQLSGFTLGFVLIFTLGWFEHVLEL